MVYHAFFEGLDSKNVSMHHLISDPVSDFVQVSLKDRERELQAIAIAERRRLEHAKWSFYHNPVLINAR